MAIKIAVAGTHSTGKTSLLQYVESELKSQGHTVLRLASLAKEAMNLGFPILRDHTFASTLWIITKGITQELEAEMKADVLLVDRPAIDAIGYLDAAMNFRNVRLADRERTYLDTLARLHSATYDCLLKTTLDQSIPIATAKVRDRDEVFRLDVDRALEAALVASTVPFVRLDSNAENSQREVIGIAQGLIAARNRN